MRTPRQFLVELDVSTEAIEAGIGAECESIEDLGCYFSTEEQLSAFARTAPELANTWAPGADLEAPAQVTTDLRYQYRTRMDLIQKQFQTTRNYIHTR